MASVMETSSLPTVSMTTTHAPSNNYDGHRESDSLTTVATTCLILIVVIGVGVAVLFCKRFVETRRSDFDDEEENLETSTSQPRHDAIDPSYEPPSYDRLLANHETCQPQRELTGENAQNGTVLSLEVNFNPTSDVIPPVRHQHRVQITGTSRPSRDRAATRTTSETLVYTYLPYSHSFSGTICRPQNKNSSIRLKADANDKVTKSCGDLDALPSYEDAIRMSHHNLTHSQQTG